MVTIPTKHFDRETKPVRPDRHLQCLYFGINFRCASKHALNCWHVSRIYIALVCVTIDLDFIHIWNIAFFA